MATDARDILGDLEQKRPEDMGLEVYGLLSTTSQDPSSLVPTNCSNGAIRSALDYRTKNAPMEIDGISKFGKIGWTKINPLDG